ERDCAQGARTRRTVPSMTDGSSCGLGPLCERWSRQTYGPTPQSVQRRAVRHERARGPVSDQASEVPVVVFGVLGLADDIGRSRTGEEVVVLITAGRE